MRLDHVTSYAAAPDRVLAVLTSPEFREQVCAAQRALHPSVQVTGSGAGARVRVETTHPVTRAPGFARRLVGDTVTLVQEETWTSATTAELSVAVPGRAARFRGTVELVGTATGTVQVVRGELAVEVPLVGGRIEQLVAPVLRSGLRVQGEVGAAWLARRD